MSTSSTPSYDLTLTSDKFLNDYSTFRNATSQNFSYNNVEYPAVYLTSDDYAYLNIHSGGDLLTLIVNLEYYYVYGFQIDGQYYAYEGEAYDSLTAAGWDIPSSNIIPYGDAYYEIASDAQIDAVCVENVTLTALQDSISAVIDMSIDWNDKREDLLRVFWCLVEGIRFSEISYVVNDLVGGTDYNTTFGYFYYMAERWAKLSIGNAYEAKTDSSIAVYELNRLK
ncbi:MAG: ribosome-inactivating family protein [Crocinitomicaceae bacterium]